jgi:hypothetical protein
MLSAMLDNLFTLVGGSGTALIMVGLFAFVGIAPATWVLCPTRSVSRLARSR